jgi:hypothetical protein
MEPDQNRLRELALRMARRTQTFTWDSIQCDGGLALSSALDSLASMPITEDCEKPMSGQKTSYETFVHNRGLFPSTPGYFRQMFEVADTNFRWDVDGPPAMSGRCSKNRPPDRSGPTLNRSRRQLGR